LRWSIGRGDGVRTFSAFGSSRCRHIVADA
jgi:hypothetical protein